MESDRFAAPAAPDLLHFGGFELDAANARLTQGDRPLVLAPKAFAVLCHLARRPGRLVSKGELLDSVWGHRCVSESVVKAAINVIRSALGDHPKRPQFLETVARRGYRFVGTASPGPAPAGALATTPAGAPATTPAGAPHPAAGTVPPQQPAGQRLIGRRQPLLHLGTLLAAAHAAQHQLVLIAGEAGIGKSTLLRGLAQQACTAPLLHQSSTAPPCAAGFAVAWGQCVEQSGGGEPYLPVLDALDELARGADGALWLTAMRQAAPTWLAQLPWLVAAADQPPLQHALAGAAQDGMLREFAALLDAVTPTRPLLLVIEDLHWSDHATISLLDYLARRRGPARWMLAASYRPDDVARNAHPVQAMRQELRQHGLCHELALQPFTEMDVASYLEDRLARSSGVPRAALAQALHRHTDGLPLFLANVVDDLQNNGALGGDGAGWHNPALALAQLQLPDTVVGVIERQIGRMPVALCQLLEAASVAGQEFNHRLLAALQGAPAEDVRGQCDALVRRAEWLGDAGLASLPGGVLASRYCFRHALYRRVFYERTLPARRVQLHLLAAQALQALPVGLGEQSAAELAQHFEGARDTAAASGAALPGVAREALTWRLRAARAAAAVHAPADALAHFSLAQSALAQAALAQTACGQSALAPSVPAHPAHQGAVEQVRIHSECAALQQQLGAGTLALARSADALALVRTLQQSALWQAVLLQHAQLSQLNDQQHNAICSVDELLASTPALGAEQRAQALIVKADALECLGQRQQADDAAAAAFACLPPDADAARAKHLASRATALFHRGEFTEGLPIIEAAFQLYERTGDAMGAASMRTVRGIFSLSLGLPQDAETALQDARARTRAINDVPGQRRALVNLVKVRTDRGDAESSLPLLDEGWQLSPSFESPVAECVFLSAYYYCNYLRGHLGQALRDAARVLASAGALSAVYWRVGSLCVVSDLYIHLGDLAQAGMLIDDAMAQCDTHQVKHHWPEVTGRRAWLDVLAGQPALALRRLDALATGQVNQVEDQAALARVRAHAWLALGDPQAALRLLAPFDGAPTQEVWTLMLALRLRAQCAAGAVADTDIQRAQADLLDSRTPALESLVLRRALADALLALGRQGAAAAQQALLLQHAQQLAATLAGAPAQRASFSRAWGLAPG